LLCAFLPLFIPNAPRHGKGGRCRNALSASLRPPRILVLLLPAARRHHILRRSLHG
jgi:hypothetical protein